MITSKSIISLALFLVILISGIVMHSGGKPYHQLIFTAHKLVALGLVVFIAFFVVNFLKANPVAAGIVPVLVTGVLFAIGLFVSGAMVSVDKGFVIMLWIHRITTAGFVICLSAVFYIVVKR